LGKIPTTLVRRLISLFTRSSPFVLQILRQCASGKADQTVPVSLVDAGPGYCFENFAEVNWIKAQIPAGTWCLGVAEIAQALGISRQTAAQWHKRGKLPPPDAELAMGPVWKVETIEAFLDALISARPLSHGGEA